MCGLTGIIFGKKNRSEEDYEEIKDLFTSLFLFSEQRGRHASGLATLDQKGKTCLYKYPIQPSKLILTQGFENVLNSISDKTTILIGHSRWKTVGSEFNNNNNQPIVAGNILGTHNGTISNADVLFKLYKFRRFAEVDSELLFRMADASIQNNVLNTIAYKKYLSSCKGSLSCVLVSKTDPENVYLFKGDKPLSIYYNPRLMILAYSSLEQYIIDSIGDNPDWYSIRMSEYTMYQTSFTDFKNIVSDHFRYNGKP